MEWERSIPLHALFGDELKPMLNSCQVAPFSLKSSGEIYPMKNEQVVPATYTTKHEMGIAKRLIIFYSNLVRSHFFYVSSKNNTII